KYHLSRAPPEQGMYRRGRDAGERGERTGAGGREHAPTECAGRRSPRRPGAAAQDAGLSLGLVGPRGRGEPPVRGAALADPRRGRVGRPGRPSRPLTDPGVRYSRTRLFGSRGLLLGVLAPAKPRPTVTTALRASCGGRQPGSATVFDHGAIAEVT